MGNKYYGRIRVFCDKDTMDKFIKIMNIIDDENDYVCKELPTLDRSALEFIKTEENCYEYDFELGLNNFIEYGVLLEKVIELIKHDSSSKEPIGIILSETTDVKGMDTGKYTFLSKSGKIVFDDYNYYVSDENQDELVIFKKHLDESMDYHIKGKHWMDKSTNEE